MSIQKITQKVKEKSETRTFEEYRGLLKAAKIIDVPEEKKWFHYTISYTDEDGVECIYCFGNSLQYGTIQHAIDLLNYVVRQEKYNAEDFDEEPKDYKIKRVLFQEMYID